MWDDGRDDKGTTGAELGLKAAFMVEYLSVKDAGLRRTLGAKGAVLPLVKWLESPGYQVCSRASVPSGPTQYCLTHGGGKRLPIRRVASRQQLEMARSRGGA